MVLHVLSPFGNTTEMDTDKNRFAAYLDGMNNHGKSLFYYRAEVPSGYFWKLKKGYKNPSPDLIVRLALASEGECKPSDVFAYFEELKQLRDVGTLLELLSKDWVDESSFARLVSRFDLGERMDELIEEGHCILTREQGGTKGYKLCE